MEELIEVLKAQTEALSRLAESNEALVAMLMAEPDEEDDGSEVLSARKSA